MSKVKAILAGYWTNNDATFIARIKEIEALCLTLNIEIADTMVQKGIGPLHSTYFKSGKLEEIRAKKEELNCELVVINDELNSAQITSIEEALDCGIVDRTSLILNIFHERAKTKQAKYQVEIAQLEYMLPRLLGSYSSLGRQGGGASARNKGLGEKKIALDKRKIERQIHALKKELKEIEKQQRLQSVARQSSEVKKVALVGYTNAGKSTLMNCLLKRCNKETKQVLEKDMLFATLDTSVRLIDAKQAPNFLLSDTVGFVHSLPPVLLEAFKTTLNEVKEADLLLHVIDLSKENYKEMQDAVIDTLKKIGADHIKIMNVYTHLDLLHDACKKEEDGILISSVDEIGIDDLIDKIIENLYGKKEIRKFFIPYSNGNQINELLRQTRLMEKEELEEGISIKVEGAQEIMRRYALFYK